jgi:hypothetical protein
MASGASAQHAAALLGIVTQLTVGTQTGAPAGNSQATAPIMPSDSVILAGTSVGASTGYKLPLGVDASAPGLVNLGDTLQVFNQGGNTLLVYPNASTGKVQGAGAGAGFSVANNKQAQFTYMGIVAGVELWAADLSA